MLEPGDSIYEWAAGELGRVEKTVKKLEDEKSVALQEREAWEQKAADAAAKIEAKQGASLSDLLRASSGLTLAPSEDPSAAPSGRPPAKKPGKPETALKATPELERALHDMIVDSSNDATHYVFNALTGTTDGPELDGDALAQWLDKRNVVNRYFAGLGYQKINTNQKPWCEGPYGRERQSLGPNFENRNKLTTEAVARLLFEIVTGRAVIGRQTLP